MGRLIPLWIGSVKVPENRNTTMQLLMCWAQIVNEVDNVKSLLRKLSTPMVDRDFVLQAQEVSMYLSQILEEKGFKPKNSTMIYTGHYTSPVGVFNSRVAGVLHKFFDEPDYKPKGSHPCIECPPDGN